MTVVVTLRVEETLKGEAGSTFSFRQFIWDVRDRYDAAGYRKGQRLLLLLNPSTPYGLTSPAGLHQGRFRIVQDSTGRWMAANALQNAGLFRGLDEDLARRKVRLSSHLANLVTTHKAGAISLEDLTGLIRQVAVRK